MATVDDKILLDSEKAKIRNVAGTSVQTIPKRWMKRPDFQAFFQSNLEIAAFRENGRLIFVIQAPPGEAQTVVKKLAPSRSKK